MLRVLICTLVVSLAPACKTFRPDNPKVSLGVSGMMLDLTGQGRMDSLIGANKQVNDYVDIGRSLSLSGLSFGFGSSAVWGDGLAGAELHYLYWTSPDLARGMLTQDFGDLRRNDTIKSESKLNQIRLQYIVKVAEYDIEDVTLRAGVGAGMHHNFFDVDMRAANAARSQTIDFADDGIPVAIVRAQAEWKPLRGTIEGAFSHGNWGDIDGTVLDLKAVLEYRMQNGIWVWGGYRAYDLPASGSKQGADFDFDMELAGWIFGIRMDF